MLRSILSEWKKKESILKLDDTDIDYNRLVDIDNIEILQVVIRDKQKDRLIYFFSDKLITCDIQEFQKIVDILNILRQKYESDHLTIAICNWDRLSSITNEFKVITKIIKNYSHTVQLFPAKNDSMLQCFYHKYLKMEDVIRFLNEDTICPLREYETKSIFPQS